MEKTLATEISKRKMAVLYYRKRVCRCLTDKVITLQKLMCNLPGSNCRYEEYRSYLDELNKVWAKLKERETIVFGEMVTAGLSAVEFDDVMRKVESYPVDEYAIYQAYPIEIGSGQSGIDENKSIIWSIGYNL